MDDDVERTFHFFCNIHPCTCNLVCSLQWQLLIFHNFPLILIDIQWRKVHWHVQHSSYCRNWLLSMILCRDCNNDQNWCTDILACYSQVLHHLRCIYICRCFQLVPRGHLIRIVLDYLEEIWKIRHQKFINRQNFTTNHRRTQ